MLVLNNLNSLKGNEVKHILKHAYLILAHKTDFTFYSLLRLIDDDRNDIFIHMDVKNQEYSEELVKKTISYSGIYFTKRTNVTWGGYSQINAELLLLKKALVVGKYQYYHLISGEDLPIKTQDYIHSFFDKINGKQLIRYENNNFLYQDRIRYFYFFQEKIGRNNKYLIFDLLNRISLKTQKKLDIFRSKKIVFRKGTNWFSITDELAAYIVSKERWIKKTFSYSLCCDEVFIQTIVYNSMFVNGLYDYKFDNSLDSIMRLIDWNRGNPYVYQKEDFDELMNSDMLWARKFDSSIDTEVINLICKRIIEG